MAPLPLPGAPDVAYLLDLSSLARGLFATLPPMQTVDGEPVSVTSALVTKLVRIIVHRRPSFLGVCADMPTARGEEEDDTSARVRRSWRARHWPGYKAGREPPGGEYDTQIDRLIEIFRAHQIPVFQAPEREADDFFGTLVPRLRRLGLRVVMVSKDQDLWQLICDGVVAWDGNASEVAIGPAEVEAKHGVPPELLADVLALAGDGDEAPGLDGIGSKRAADLVMKHAPSERVPSPGEVLELILERWQWALGAKSKPTKVSESLRTGREMALLSFKLVHLAEDPTLPMDLTALRVGWSQHDAEAIRGIGAKLSISALREVTANPKTPLNEDLWRRWIEHEGVLDGSR